MSTMPVRQIPPVYHRRIGAFVVTALSDGILERTHEMMHGVGADESRRHLDAAFLRELLRDQAALLAPEDDTREVQTAASLLVRLGSHEQELPVCWYAFATPSASVYFPMFVAADVPIAFADEAGRGSRVWRTLRGWQEEARRDPRLRSALQSGLAGLQERLDDNLREFLPDANDLHRRGDADGLRRLAGSFMQHCLERFEELAAALQPRSASSVVAPQEELIEAW